MDKLRMQTPDLIQTNIEKLAALFPACVTEARGRDGKLKRAVNFALLRQLLSDEVLEGGEAYEFTWVGKKAAIVEANRPIRKTLRPCPEESLDWDSTENLYIEGDNLEVLKLLQESYLGKVKMIYIDPPYNTGNDFIYRDNFAQSQEEYREESGQVDENGDRLLRNTGSNGRFHSDWCSMIYSRLMLARNLLRNDGVIFISIDDNEQENLKKCCDEIFGSENYINRISLKTKASAGASGGGEDKRLKKNTESILIYSKNRLLLDMEKPVEYVPIGQFIQEHKENKIGFYYTRILEDFGTKKLIGTFDHMKVYQHTDFVFSTVSEKMKREHLSLDEVYQKYYDRIFMVTNAQTSLLTKVNDITPKEQMLISYEYTPRTGKDKDKLISKYIWNKTLVVWFADSAIKNKDGVFKAEQIGTLWDDISWGRLDLQGDVPFKNGKKPLKLLDRMLRMASRENDIILDFFSGSATTAHAVMQLNAEEGGHRKFIMVQLPEPCDEQDEAYRAGFPTICEIGKERIRRAAGKIAADNPGKEFDGGFRVFKLDDTNMTDVYYSAVEYDQAMLSALESNIKSDRTDLDLLFGCLLEWGLPLSMHYTSEKMEGCTIHTYAPGDAAWKVHAGLIACFDENIPAAVLREIAGRRPLRAVFRDDSFADSPSKINMGEIFKMLAPDTSVKVL